MKYIDIFKYLNDSNVAEKKIFIKSVYYKFLILDKKIRDKKLTVSIDSYDNLIKETIVLPKIYLKKKFILGYSLNLNSYKFKNIQKVSTYKLNIPIFFQKFFLSSFLDKIKLSLANEIPKFIVLVTSIKGGYLVYSNGGIKGFLPYKQSKYLRTSPSTFSKTIFSKKFYLLWFYVKTLSFKLALYKKNFKKRFKGRYFRYNFVFLLNKFAFFNQLKKIRLHKLNKKKKRYEKIKSTSNFKKKINYSKKK